MPLVDNYKGTSACLVSLTAGAPLGATRNVLRWYIAAAGAGTNAVVLGIVMFGFGVFLEEFRVT